LPWHEVWFPQDSGRRQLLTPSSLAFAEMNHLLAALFRENGPRFELYETDKSDVSPAHDFVVPLPKVETKGVRVIF